MPPIGTPSLTATAKLRPQFGPVSLPTTQEYGPLSWGMLFLMFYAAFAIGRVQEAVPILASLRIGLLTGGLAALAWSFAPGTWQEKIPFGVQPVRYTLLLLGLAVLTIPIGVWPAHSFDGAISFAKTVLLFLMVILWCRTLTDMRRLLWMCCLSTLAIVILGMLSGASQERFAAGESYDANDLALILVMTLPLILYLFSTTQGAVMRLLLGGMAFICLLAILRTQSRGGFLALLGVGTLILLRTPMSRLNKAITIAVALVIFIGMSDHAYWERMGTIWDPQSEYESTGGGRTEIWKAGLRLIAERPWGVGIDGFETAEGQSHGGLGKWNSAHNSFIQLGVELGIVGMVIFVLLLVTALKQLRGIRSLSRDTGHLAGKARLQDKAETIPFQKNIGVLASTLETSLLGFAIGGFFVSHAYNALLYTLIALTICCHRLLQSAKTQDPSLSQKPGRLPAAATNIWSARKVRGSTSQ